MRFHVLDSWRGIAAIGVVLVHAPFWGAAHELAIRANFALFVAFFFVLSGFVIAHAYGDRIKSAPDAVNFAIRRFGRLYPLHAATLAAMLLLEIAKLVAVQVAGAAPGTPPFEADNSLPALAANLAMLQGVGILPHETWNGPSWSISAEFWTYMIFATLALWGAFSKLSPLLATSLIGLFALLLLQSYGANAAHTALFSCIYHFFLGCVLYKVWRRAPAIAARNAALLEILAVASLVGLFLLPHYIRDNVAPLSFCALIWVFAYEKGPLSALLRIKPMLTLGALSYSIYMVHMPIIAGLKAGLRVLGLGAEQPVFEVREINGKSYEALAAGGSWAMDGLSLGLVAASVLVAAWTFAHIETPGRLWFNALADRVTRGAARPA